MQCFEIATVTNLPEKVTSTVVQRTQLSTVLLLLDFIDLKWDSKCYEEDLVSLVSIILYRIKGLDIAGRISASLNNCGEFRKDVGRRQAVLPDQDEAVGVGRPEPGRAGDEEAGVAQEEAGLPK